MRRVFANFANMSANFQLFSSTVEQLDGKSGISHPIEWKMLSVFGELTDSEREHVERTMQNLNSLNANIQLNVNLLQGVKEDDVTREKIQGVLNSLYRQKNRIVRFNIVHQKGTDWQKEIANGKDVDSIRAADLLKLENEWRWFLSKTFSYREIVDQTGNVLQEPLDANRIQEGDTVVIDFWKNASANASIGAADILPPSVQIVKITDLSGETRTGRREWGKWRVWYYDEEGRYLPIYTGYHITVPRWSELRNEWFSLAEESPIILRNESEIERLQIDEHLARKEYVQRLESKERSMRSTQVISDIRNRSKIGVKRNPQELLDAMMDAIEHDASVKEKYTENELKDARANIERARWVMRSESFTFDLSAYKQAIAMRESGGGDYHARNDGSGKRRGVSSEKWAFGKYQFTVETLRSYGVDLWNPPSENKIQEFLNNESLQEELADRYVIDFMARHKGTIDELQRSEGRSTVFYLALGHIGGGGALKNRSGGDWLGTKKEQYAAKVAEYYESITA